jgi:uncharacterized phage-associated protein
VNALLAQHPGSKIVNVTSNQYMLTAYLDLSDRTATFGMDDFTDKIIAIANDLNLPITNLGLMLISYLTMQELLQNDEFGSKLEQIYDQKFEVWRYGPTIRAIREKYSINGAEPLIECPSHNAYFAPFHLEQIVEPLLNTSMFDLVERSHQEAFWIQHQGQIENWRSNVQYSLNDLKKGIANVKRIRPLRP